MTQPKVSLAESCGGRSPAEKGALRGIKYGVPGILVRNFVRNFRSTEIGVTRRKALCQGKRVPRVSRPGITG